MSLQEIAERWKDMSNQVECEDWWYAAIRHCQRNVDDLCDCDDSKPHPGRYDGRPHAYASADIHWLLTYIGAKE